MEDDGFYKFNHKAVDALNSVDHTNIELVLSTSIDLDLTSANGNISLIKEESNLIKYLL